MIDLHIHTKCSDGSDDPLTILKKAQELNLSCISITDHDNCYAYKELKNINIKDYYDGTLIKGVELKTKVLGVAIELLGYGIDTDIINEGCEKIYPKFKVKNIVEAKKLLETCKRIGVKIDENVEELDLKAIPKEEDYKIEISSQKISELKDNQIIITVKDGEVKEEYKIKVNIAKNVEIDEEELKPTFKYKGKWTTMIIIFSVVLFVGLLLTKKK